MRSKTNFFQLIIVALIAVVLSSCGLGKMVKNYPQVKFQATPTVLENHGGKVNVTIKGEVPPKYFEKMAVMVFQPVVTYNGGTKELKPITLKGEKVKGDGTIINKKLGGSFTYTETFDFVPGMTAANLEIGPAIYKAKGKDEVKAGLKKADVKIIPKSIELGNRKLADGVINTSQKIYHDEDLLLGDQKTVTKLIKGSDADFYEKETIVTNGAKIYFVVNQSDLSLSYKLNKDKAAKTILDTLSSFLKKEWKVKSVDINAWASPEGEESRNQGLSDNRAKTGNNFMVNEYKKLLAEKKEAARKAKKKDKTIKIEDVKVQDVTYATKANGEDWEGFMQAVSASTIKDKNTILNVVRSQADPVKREQEIRNMTVIYKEIEEDILPPLRRAEISVKSYLPKKTDEQIARLSTTHPDSLDVKELLYSHALTQDANTQLKIFKSMTTLYPTDWKGYNNVGFASMKLGNLDEAKTFLEKANTMSPNNPLVLNNLGALAAANGDYAGAKTYYKSAQDVGADESYNKGILTILDGDYKGASSLMGAKKCNYNIALVELLTGNAASAASTLQCAPDNAEKFYLMAVAGARTGNQSMVMDNLKKAVGSKSSLKGIAKEDREFLKYFDNVEFQSIVK